MPKLGYRPDLERRDLIAAGSAPFALRIRGEGQDVDPRERFWIRDQGNQSSCRGHSLRACGLFSAIATAGEADLDGDGRTGEKDDDDISPQWCYVESQKADGIRGDEGATIFGGIEVGKGGMCRESLWPYTGRYETRPADPAAAVEDARQFTFARYTQFERGDVDAMDAWLSTGQGAIDWGKMWPLPFQEGCLVDSGIREGRNLGGHATAIIGRTRAGKIAAEIPALRRYLRDEAAWIYIAANSHGTRAQHQGYYFLTRRGLEACSAHRWTEAIGWSDLTVPRRREIDFTKTGTLGHRWGR